MAQIPTNGLLAQYGFDNGSLVDGANGINFTQTGSALIAVDDRFHTASQAIQLNGDHLSRADIDYASTYDDFSISFWVKTATNTTDTKTIFFDYGGTFPVGYHIYLKDGKITLTHTASLGSSYKTSTAQSNFIADGNWHNVIAVLDQCVAKVYIDGQLEATGVNNNPQFYLNRLIDSVGSFVVSNNRNYNLGSINKYEDILDDILIYNRVLTTADITSIVTENSYCFAPSNTLLSVNGITETTASITLNATASGTFEYVIVQKGQPINTGQIFSIAAGATVPLTGLSSSTSYEFFLRKECTASFDSDWSSAFNFRTKGTIYVNANASGANTGSDWANAYNSLQDALIATNENEEIWVAAGVYVPSIDKREATFAINKEAIKLYGGFVGTEINRSERDVLANETILSGDLQNNDNATIDFVNTTRNDNSYNIITINANNTEINGFTIANGHANGTVIEKKLGAAIYKTPSVGNLEIKNCTFRNNVAHEGASAIFSRFSSNGTLRIHNTIFSNNVSKFGTCIYSYTDNNINATIEIVSSLFNNNTAKDNASSLGYAGSAGWFRAYGTSSVLNISLINNTYYGNIDTGTWSGLNNFNRCTVGLGYASGVLNATVANSIFWNNTTAGGATAKSIAQVVDNLGQNITVKNATSPDSFSNVPSGSVTNVLNSNPLFVDALNGDFTLNNNSPAIDSGDNASVIGTTDLLGNQRIFNTTVDRGVYEFGSTVLGNASFQNFTNFQIYPNPVINSINVVTSEGITSLEIYTLEGKLVLKTNEDKIDVSDLQNGLYLIKVTSNQNEVGVKKFIKE